MEVNARPSPGELSVYFPLRSSPKRLPQVWRQAYPLGGAQTMIESNSYHTENGPDRPSFICEICDEKFDSKDALERHLKTIGLVN